MSKKDFNKIEVKNKICINAFCYEEKLTYPVHISDQKFKNSMDLLIILNKIKSHYVYIEDFNKFMNKQKTKIKQKTKAKNTFVSITYSVLTVKEFL